MKRLFVIQEHEAKRAGKHWDIRFEDKGDTDTYLSKREKTTTEPMRASTKVLRSFAVPKHKLPAKGEKILATPTEDHPWAYKDFKGVIPSGYGAGVVKLLFSDYIEVSVFEESKIKFEFGGVKYTMFQMKGQKPWLIMRAKED
jgi:DNA polymerase Ligase (LigD)